jgi:hypothetical protein
VQALRRTVRDLLAFVPFTIILIVPLTPVVGAAAPEDDAGVALMWIMLSMLLVLMLPPPLLGRRQIEGWPPVPLSLPPPRLASPAASSHGGGGPAPLRARVSPLLYALPSTFCNVTPLP